MDYCMRLMGLSYRHFPAVDGKKITQADIKKAGIAQLPGFSDPHHPRTITKGEVGCFLSHYKIWLEAQHMDIVMVLEDDVRFKVKQSSSSRDEKMILAIFRIRSPINITRSKRSQPRLGFNILGSETRARCSR